MRTSIVWDLLVLAGAVLALRGVAQIYAPLGWILAGLVVTAIGVWGALTVARERRKQR
jgi:hypothetical protein